MITAGAGTPAAQQGQTEFNIFLCQNIGNRPLTKSFSLVDGAISKKPATPTAAGKVFRIETSFYPGFFDALNDADCHTAFIYGVFENSREQMYLVSKADKSANPGNPFEICRTKEYFSYPNKPGILMFDHDPSDYGQNMTPAEFLQALGKLYPPMLDAAHIVRGSVSAGVSLAGEQPKPKPGFHAYFAVQDASDIPRFISVLTDMAWLQGYGFYALSKSGACLERVFFDTAVYSPERLDYVGSPIINAGVAYTAPVATYTPGAMLDTRGLQ